MMIKEGLMNGLLRRIVSIWIATMLLSGCIQPVSRGNSSDTNTGQMLQPSVVVTWNEAMLAAVRIGPPRPTVIARSLFMVHQAMYDAWSLYDPVATPVLLHGGIRRPAAEHTDANKAAAISQAAYHMLVALFCWSRSFRRTSGRRTPFAA